MAARSDVTLTDSCRSAYHPHRSRLRCTARFKRRPRWRRRSCRSCLRRFAAALVIPKRRLSSPARCIGCEHHACACVGAPVRVSNAGAHSKCAGDPRGELQRRRCVALCVGAAARRRVFYRLVEIDTARGRRTHPCLSVVSAPLSSVSAARPQRRPFPSHDRWHGACAACELHALAASAQVVGGVEPAVVEPAMRTIGTVFACLGTAHSHTDYGLRRDVTAELQCAEKRALTAAQQVCTGSLQHTSRTVPSPRRMPLALSAPVSMIAMSMIVGTCVEWARAPL